MAAAAKVPEAPTEGQGSGLPPAYQTNYGPPLTQNTYGVPPYQNSYAAPPPAGGPPPPPGPGMYGPGYAPNPYMAPARMMFTSSPQRMMCSHCGADVQTNVSYEIGMGTWIMVGGLVLVGLGLGCCIVPLFVDQCKDAVHTCPNCNKYLGTKKVIDL